MNDNFAFTHFQIGSPNALNLLINSTDIFKAPADFVPGTVPDAGEHLSEPDKAHTSVAGAGGQNQIINITNHSDTQRAGLS